MLTLYSEKVRRRLIEHGKLRCGYRYTEWERRRICPPIIVTIIIITIIADPSGRAV